MNYTTATLLAMLATAGSLSAQTTPPLRAFPTAVSAALGLASFDPRVTENEVASYAYKGSLLVSLRYDQPITRRTGLLLSLATAPLSQQRGESDVSTVLTDAVVIGIADVAAGFRFKPTAPVFFSAGGGMTYATRRAYPDASGAATEPHALFAIGYDAKSSNSWNVRTVFSNRFIIPSEDDQPETERKSFAHDWTLEIGGRYVFGKRAPR